MGSALMVRKNSLKSAADELVPESVPDEKPYLETREMFGAFFSKMRTLARVTLVMLSSCTNRRTA